jgi:glycosyltransferase involved in cell wall biosynthesis
MQKISFRSCPNQPVSIVVPCFNEQDGLPHLKEKLASARVLLRKHYSPHFILIDDGSTDGTWNAMCQLFDHDPDCVLLRRPKNLGISDAILNGIRLADTEIVCSMDSDCTYDPSEFIRMIPLLARDVDLVTASPYHPLGAVQGVPGWRLLLSRTASLLYGLVLKQKLHTYTSCFRVYRRSSILKLKLQQGGFLGVAELIGKLDLQNSVIAECPAKLTSRAYGVSKMKTLTMLFGHFLLLGELAFERTRQAFSTSSRVVPPRLSDL